MVSRACSANPPSSSSFTMPDRRASASAERKWSRKVSSSETPPALASVSGARSLRAARAYARPVGRDRLAPRGDRLPHALADGMLDRGRVSRALIAEQRDVLVEVTDRSRSGAARRGGRERILLIRDTAEAIARAGGGESRRGDALEIGVRDVDDRGRVGARSAVALDQRRAQRPQQTLAPDDAPLARVRRSGVRSEEERRGDRGPPTEGVLDRRLAEDKVRLALFEIGRTVSPGIALGALRS